MHTLRMVDGLPLLEIRKRVIQLIKGHFLRTVL